MGDVVKSIFSASTFGIFDSLFGGGADDVQEKITPPSGLETAAQKEQSELLEAQEKVASQRREARQKVITARAAGPQTLFKRADEIPKAVKLGGGRRA